MCLSGHIIDDEWDLRSYLLEQLPLVGSVTGEAIEERIQNSVRQWGVSNITKTLMSDQGTNVLKAERLAKWLHLHCFDHRLDLCITTSVYII